MNEMNEMNEWDALETRLRCWEPRRPSPALERRLFRRVPAGLKPVMMAGWLAPAAACLVFAGLILNQQKPGSPPSGGLVALALSNQSYAAYLPGSFQRTHNQLETFTRAAGDSLFVATNYLR